MSQRNYFFAGGGTGGHIYPALAVAERIKEKDPDARITFFCSQRPIDSKILSQTGFDFVCLPATGFSTRPSKFIPFCVSFIKSFLIVKRVLASTSGKSTIIGVGGFVSVPAALAAAIRRLPISLINVDITPGKANKLLASIARRIFVQFDETVIAFGKRAIVAEVTGCPLRAGFASPDRQSVINQLSLDENKKTLVVTGASSGSANINRAFCSILPLLDNCDDWQIVHLTGFSNHANVETGYADAKIAHKLLLYYDNMPDLYAVADLVIGRAGAVSIAEYAAASVPSICIPYPFHADMHQYLNAGKLTDAGAAVIVDDLADTEQTANNLAEKLLALMEDDRRREDMSIAAKAVANTNAAETIAEKIMGLNY